jgi:hypothetical protein
MVLYPDKKIDKADPWHQRLSFRDHHFKSAHNYKALGILINFTLGITSLAEVYKIPERQKQSRQ